ncbi:hypothetical protein AAHB60_10320 [Pseudomonas aeruginosa]
MAEQRILQLAVDQVAGEQHVPPLLGMVEAAHENAKAFHDKCGNKVTQTLDKG